MMFSSRSFAISCLVAIIVASAAAATGVERIVGGITTTIDKTPYAVQFRYANGGLFCGGTLVRPQYVVTAAHCFPSGQGNNAIVVGGVTTINGMGVERKIVSVQLHTQYSQKTMHSDVAVVKLDQPMYGANIRTIGLCSQPLREGDSLQVSGWGQTADVGPLSQQLRTVFLPVSPRGMCDNEYRSFVSKNMFCGSGKEAKGHCFGDSGGPAVFNNELCGINSFGYKCGDVGKTVAFTDVYKVHSFIDNALRM